MTSTSYWISGSVHHKKNEPGTLKCDSAIHQLWLSFDQETLRRFSRVRLVVTTDSKNDDPEYWREISMSRTENPRSSNRTCRAVCHPHSDSVADVMTIVFRLQRTPNRLTPLEPSWRCLHEATGLPVIPRILTDRTFLLPPTQRSYHFAFELGGLLSDRDMAIFTGQNALRVLRPSIPPPERHIYTFQIMTTRSHLVNRKPFPHLPVELLRKVVLSGNSANSSSYLDWPTARTVMKCSLLSKHWSSVRSLLWDLVLGSSPHGLPITQFLKLSQLVSENSVIRSRFRFFPSLNVIFRRRASRADAHLLKAARSFIENVPGLRNMATYYLPRQIMFNDILKDLKCLSRMETLSIYSWATPPKQRPPDFENPEALSCRLLSLTLVDGFIVDHQLRAVISSANQRLRHLKLHSVRGLTESGLYELFWVTRETLEKIAISSSWFEREKPTFPFESVLPSMKKIRIVKIEGSLVSNRVFTQKSTSSALSNPRCSITITNYSRNLVHAHTDPHGIGLVKAVENTAWNEIKLIEERSGCGYGERPLEVANEIIKAIEVAKARGINMGAKGSYMK